MTSLTVALSQGCSIMPDQPAEEDLPIAVDFDGTLAVSVWPDPGIGAPIRRNIVKVRELYRAGYQIVIHTARPHTDSLDLSLWLMDHNVPFDRIVCDKLLARLYVDDRARHADEADWKPPKPRCSTTQEHENLPT